MDTPLLNCTYKNAQKELLDALKDRNIDSFRQILSNNNNASVDLEEPHDDNYLSIFHYACQRAGYHEFVAECIEYGCDVNRVNEHFQKTSINFAVESLDLANIALIANQLHTNLDHKYEDNTPLNFLASKLNDTNYGTVFECIRLLIERQANPNIPNNRQFTPIVHVLKNKEISRARKEAVLTFLLDNANDIDLDNYRKGEARKLLVQEFSHLDLPPIAEKLEWSFTTLRMALINGKEAAFLRGLNDVYTELYNNKGALDELFAEQDGDETLLIAAARHNRAMAVERMIRLGANVNHKIRKNSSPIEIACHFGHYRILELLLKTPNIELRTAEPLLLIVVKRVGDATTATCDYNKCFDLLINHPGMDIDRTDINGCSALHYAVQYSQKRLVLKLLEKGAYLGVNNKFNHLAIHDLDADTLETHLNSCISTNDSRSGEDRFEVIFDYMNLVPCCYKPKCVAQLGRKLPTYSCEFNEYKNEMIPISYIAESKDLRHLLVHPLITSFIFLKWSRLSTIFYVNLILYCIFQASVLSFILCCYLESYLSHPIQEVLRTLSWVLVIVMVVRETLQFLMSPKTYIKSAGNYLEMVLLGLVITILAYRFENDVTERSIAALTILLLFAELFLLLGSLKWMNFSTHLIMLKTVSISFIKSFMLYSLILFAFSLCFFTLLNEKSYRTAAVGHTNASHIVNGTTSLDGAASTVTPEDGDDFNKFKDIHTAVLKTLVMLTGEFEAASINFELNRTSYFIFLVFLFFISTVLFNLLSGLAVSDTQQILSQAELTDLIHRVEMMGRYESIALCPSDNYIRSFVKSWASSHMSLFKGKLPLNKIIVHPNAKNKISICQPQETDRSAYVDIDPEFDDHKALFNVPNKWQCWANVSPMKKSVMKKALRVIELKRQRRIEANREQELQDRMRRIEENISIIADKMKILTDNHIRAS